MNIVTQNERLQEALLQAEYGHRVHPCHYITEAGGCSCGKCDGPQFGKHPALAGWQKLATTKAETLQEWWCTQPERNIGIATGPGSDLLIVDIDVRGGKNGFRDLQELDPGAMGFEGIETPKARTGSGGAQLYFTWPKNCKLSTGSGIGGKAIDYRGIGGNAIAPGSRNNLGRYDWIFSLSECSKADCPDWLLTFLAGGKPEAKPQSARLTIVVAEDLDIETHPGAGEGERNGLLCKLVGRYLAEYGPDENLLRLALAWNKRCKPPKGEAGIRKSVAALIQTDWRKLRAQANGQHPESQQASPMMKAIGTGAPAEMVLVTRRASDIRPQVLRWLWPSHIQAGAVNLIAGPEGRGKSLVAVDITARTSTGSDWPDGTPCDGGRVLYCSAEENIEAVVIPRLMAAGADLGRIEIVDGLGSSTDDGKVIADVDLKRCLPAVYKKLKEGGDPFRLCVWDTFQSCSLTTNHKENTDQKAIVQPLQAIADELGIAMVCIEHHNRGGLGRGNPDSAILGGGLTRTARVIWHVVEDPDDPESTRLFIPGKMNNCSKSEDLGWKFTFTDVERTIEGRQVILPRIEWLEAAGVTIHQVQDRMNNLAGDSSEDHADEFHRACDWLRAFLTEARPQEEVKAGWKSEMLSERTIRRAKAHLLIGSEQRDRKWYWLPSPQVTIGSEVITESHIAKT